MVDKITNPPSQKGVIDKINEVIDNIPIVNNATLTITQGGVSKGTFTANASSNVTIDLDAGGGSSVNLVGKLPITVQETQSGGATNIDTSGGYIKNTYNNLQQSSSTTSSMAVISNSGIGTSPSTVKELFTGNVSYFDVPTNFGERATASSGTLVTDTLRLGGYSSLNSNYYPVVMWGVLASDGEFTPVIYQRAYGSGTMMNGYVSSVANNSSNSIKLNMLVAETSTTSTSSSTSAGYNFTVSLLANGNMNARWDRYNGTTDYYINRELNSTSGASIFPDFKRINCIRVFLYGNSTNSYLPTVNDTTLTQDSVVTSWKVTDTSQAGLTIGINIDSTPTSASTNAITSGAVYTALGNKQDTLVSGTNIKTINSTSLLGSGNIDVLQNTATGTNSLGILSSTSSSYNFGYSVAIGANSLLDSDYSVALGYNTRTNNSYSTAIGYNAQTGGYCSIQLGNGTNSTASTFKVGFFRGTDNTAHNWELLDGTTGLIPDARLSTNIARTSQIPTVPTNISAFTNDSGYITSSALSGYATETWVGNQGYLTGITSSDVTTALGYTPYNSSNPNGYTSNVGTVTSVNNVSPVDGNVTLTIPGLPSQTGHSGDVLTTDGTDASWADTTTVYPVVEVSPENILPALYRIYAPDSTGYRWCEMGDLYYKGSTVAGDNTINFLKNFKDLNFEFTPTPLHSTANLNQYQMYEKYPDRTVSSVNLHVTAAVFGYSWTAEGYIANEV